MTTTNTTTQEVSNPFALMMDPEAVFAAVARSERLARLTSRICRPLDKISVPREALEAPAANVVEAVASDFAAGFADDSAEAADSADAAEAADAADCFEAETETEFEAELEAGLAVDERAGFGFDGDQLV